MMTDDDKRGNGQALGPDEMRREEVMRTAAKAAEIRRHDDERRVARLDAMLDSWEELEPVLRGLLARYTNNPAARFARRAEKKGQHT